MTRMTAKDFPQEILELYDYYAHGKITKRELQTSRLSADVTSGAAACFLLLAEAERSVHYAQPSGKRRTCTQPP